MPINATKVFVYYMTIMVLFRLWNKNDLSTPTATTTTFPNRQDVLCTTIMWRRGGWGKGRQGSKTFLFLRGHSVTRS